MKILFVTSMPLEYNFSSNMRNIALIKGLCQLGHRVDVCTYEPDQRYNKYDVNMNVCSNGTNVIIGKDLQLNNLTTDNSTVKDIKRILRKLYLKLSPFDAKILQVIKDRNIRINESYDLMISSSDPKSSQVLANNIYKRNTGKIAKWIQYWGDPFRSDINRESILPGFIFDMIEKNIYKNSDCIVYTSPITLETQKEKFNTKRMFYIPTASQIIGDKITDNMDMESLKIGYFGGYNKKDRNIFPLVEAVMNTNHRLYLYGETDVEIPESQRIVKHKFVGQNEVMSSIKTMDVLVCLCNRNGTQIPGKIYHYGMSYKRVLVILDGENRDKIKKWLEPYNRYIICENDKESIISTLKNLPSSKSLLTPVNEFLPSVVAQKFINSIT